MAVEILPLGTPEWGMTRAELLDLAFVNVELSSSAVDTFITLLFAYVVAMFVAGRQLTRAQYLIGNSLYILCAGTTIFSVGDYLIRANMYVRAAGIEPDRVDDLYLFIVGFYFMLVLFSIWFGRKIRHPTTELPQ